MATGQDLEARPGRLARLRVAARATPARRRARRIAAIALAVLATLVLGTTVLVAYLDRAVLDSGQFATRATTALQSDEMRTVLSEEMTDRVIIRAERDLLPLRPLLEGATSAIIGSAPFRDLFHGAVEDAHRSIFTQDTNTVTLTIADALVLVRGAVARFAPKLARRIDASGPTIRLPVDSGPGTLDVARAADDVRGLVAPLAVLAALLFAAALLVSLDRRRTATFAGVAVVVLALALIAAWQLGRALVLDRFGDADARAAAGALWNAFLLDLRTVLLILAGAGAIVAASAASLLRPVEIDEPLRRTWRAFARVPDRAGLAVAQAAILIVVGGLIIADRSAAIEIAVLAAGAYIVYTGVARMLALIVQPRAERSGEAPPPDPGTRVGRRSLFLRAGIVCAIAVVLIGGGVAAFVGGGAARVERARIDACNGSAELCDRPFNDVVLAATHNSMSSAATRGWLFGEQERDIPDQLSDGIRGLLIDTHYGEQMPNGGVRTDLGEIGSAQRRKFEREIGPEALDAALRIRDRLGFEKASAGPRRVYLCHGFCELGAIPLVDTFVKIRDFLVTHPNDVIAIVIEDGGVKPADVVKAANESGLAKFAYRGRMEPPFPTLRWMIRHDQRAVITAEEHAGGAPWYRRAYDYMQETPYEFPNPSLLTSRRHRRASCAPNRGPKDAALFLINNWVQTTPAPRPSNAAKVNAYGPLLARARACDRIRDRLPNLIAVDFYRTGDVLKVVRTLNRETQPDG